MAGYGQNFYTQQERDDAYAMKLEANPNRVGSGFVNYGPQVRNQQPAANWQTQGCVGTGASTPAQVSQIWGSTPTPPHQQGPGVQPFAAPPPPHAPAQQLQQLQVQQQAFGAPPQQPQLPPQPGVQPFAATTQQPKDVSAIFQSLGIDTNPQARPGQPALSGVGQQPGFPGMTSMPLAFPTGLNPVSAMSAAAMSAPAGTNLQQPFANGGLGGAAATAPPPPQNPASLMSLLQTPAANSTLNAGAFAPLGNGTVAQGACGSRAQAAFSIPVPPAPQCQLPQNMSASTAFAPQNNAFAPSASRGPPSAGGPQSARGPPKALSSASDYANAAQNYKPPPTRAASSATSISRKPEISSKTSSAPSQPKEEWECPRCTFLNNSALWECEMCGFERTGKQEQQTEASEDAGWTVSSSVRKSVPVSNSVLGSGKSKAQSKNEKRRAKKRGDP